MLSRRVCMSVHTSLLRQSVDPQQLTVSQHLPDAAPPASRHSDAPQKKPVEILDYCVSNHINSFSTSHLPNVVSQAARTCCMTPGDI